MEVIQACTARCGAKIAPQRIRSLENMAISIHSNSNYKSNTLEMLHDLFMGNGDSQPSISHSLTLFYNTKRGPCPPTLSPITSLILNSTNTKLLRCSNLRETWPHFGRLSNMQWPIMGHGMAEDVLEAVQRDRKA